MPCFGEILATCRRRCRVAELHFRLPAPSTTHRPLFSASLRPCPYAAIRQTQPSATPSPLLPLPAPVTNRTSTIPPPLLFRHPAASDHAHRTIAAEKLRDSPLRTATLATTFPTATTKKERPTTTALLRRPTAGALSPHTPRRTGTFPYFFDGVKEAATARRMSAMLRSMSCKRRYRSGKSSS